jgi:hypothetical protein
MLGSSESLLNPLQLNRLAFQCQPLTLQLVEKRFNPDISRITCCDRGYGRPAGRPQMSHLATYRSGTPQLQSRGTAGRLPGGKPIFTVSRLQFMKHPG